MSRNIQAGEVGRLITTPNLGIDWAAVPYTLKLHIYTDAHVLVGTFSMTAAVPANVQSAQISTTAAMFPTAGSYLVQVVAYSGATTMLRSTVAVVVVLPNPEDNV
jgi:hypothetical protein